MTLSQSVESRLEIARSSQDIYVPRPEIVAELSKKVLLMLVGPPASGKSTVIDAAAILNPDYTAVKTLTTRETREFDDGQYTHMPHDDDSLEIILDDIDRKEFVQYGIHPTTGNFYGTYIHDYKTTYNMLAVLSGSVHGLRKAGFERTHTLHLVNESSQWATWFSKRYPLVGEERNARIAEAISSNAWVLDDTRVEIIKNHVNNPELTARLMMNKTHVSDNYRLVEQNHLAAKTMA